MRLAEEARLAEERRLQEAIEAEERRKAEEAARAEEERKQVRARGCEGAGRDGRRVEETGETAGQGGDGMGLVRVQDRVRRGRQVRVQGWLEREWDR